MAPDAVHASEGKETNRDRGSIGKHWRAYHNRNTVDSHEAEQE
jgi:hypothetical protein